MWVLLLLAGAWVTTFVSCGRLCLTAATVGSSAVPAAPPGTAPATSADRPDHGAGLSLYETAYLSGGPDRLADVALVSMSGERSMLLAHTGWATAVGPPGRDEIERSVITTLGPEGQSRIPAVRAALATEDAVRSLADHLVAAGLAVPEAVRADVTAAIRRVRRTAVLVLVAGLAAQLLGAGTQNGSGTLAPWFALPLVLTLGCLAIARWEVGPLTRWASPAGERLLRGVDGTAVAPPASAGRDRAVLTALAVRGVNALPQAELRAALGGARNP